MIRLDQLKRQLAQRLEKLDVDGATDGSYQADVIVFYDYQLKPLKPDNIAPKESSIQLIKGDGYKESTIGDAANYSLSEQTFTQDLTVAKENALTTSLSQTNSLTFGQSINVGVEADIGFLGTGASISTDMGFTAEQVFETATTRDTSRTDSVSRSTSVSVVLPPHTQTVIQQESGPMEATFTFDVPMTVQYKVAVLHYGYSWKYSPISPNVNPYSSVVTTFSAQNGSKDAYDDAYRRVKGSYSEPLGFKWTDTSLNNKTVTVDDKTYTLPYPYTKAMDCANKLSMDFPMMKDSATSKITSTGTSTSLKGIYPLSNLTSVEPTNTDPYTMVGGDELNLNDIEIQGYNASHVPYYGFDGTFGNWALCDDTGTVIADNDSTIAAITTDPVNGNRRLVANDAQGTVYLTYQIDEDRYQTVANVMNAASLPKYITQDNISPAIVRVNVQQTPFAGVINASGYLDMYDNETVNLNNTDIDTFAAEARDTLGAYTNVALQWISLDSRIATVEDNVLTPVNTNLSVPQTVQVRAGYRGVYSDPITVSILPHPKLQTFEIGDAAGQFADYVLHDGTNVRDLQMLEALAKDQYGNLMADFDATQITWSVTKEGVPVDLSTENQFTAQSPGTYTINATYGGVTSNSLTWTVKEARMLKSLAISGDLMQLQIGAPFDLNQLTVSGTDQYGQAFAVPNESRIWNQTGDATILTGSTITGVTGGSGTVYLSVDNRIGETIASNALNYKVTGAITPPPPQPPPGITFDTLTAAQPVMSAAGGKQAITLTGNNLPSGVAITAYDSSGKALPRLTAKTAGTATEQSVVLKFPANRTKADIQYTLKCSYPADEVIGSPEAVVTVRSK